MKWIFISWRRQKKELLCKLANGFIAGKDEGVVKLRSGMIGHQELRDSAWYGKGQEEKAFLSVFERGIGFFVLRMFFFLYSFSLYQILAASLRVFLTSVFALLYLHKFPCLCI